jgi:protein transport protein SEC61 subunit gamma-like protein
MNLQILKTLKEYVRILKLTRRPSREEFTKISEVSAAGILIIGLVGFLIYLLMDLI